MQKHSIAWMRLLVIFGLALALLVAVAGPVAASDFRGGDTVTIDKGQVIDDDLLIGANNVVMNGIVNGNLLVAGSNVEINGTVNGSLFVGGQTIRVNGLVTGSLYGGGNSLTLGPQASIEHNTMFGGYAFRAETGSIIRRDLDAAGYQAELNGDVSRDVRFAGNALHLTGNVGRDLSAEVGNPGVDQAVRFMGPEFPPAIAVGLHISSLAKIGGQLTYRSDVPQSETILVKPVGGITYLTPSVARPDVTRPLVSDVVADKLREFATLLLLGLIAIWTLPRLMTTLAAKAEASPIAAAGWGLLVLVGGYMLAIVLLVVIIVTAILLGIASLGGLVLAVLGIGFTGLGLAVTVFTLLVAYGAEVVVSYLIGKLILQQFSKEYADHKVVALVVGLVLYELVTLIPMLGGLVSFIATLIGLGAMLYAWRTRGVAITSVGVAMPAE